MKFIALMKIFSFEIPENWRFIRLKELWELISGRDLSPSEYITIIKMVFHILLGQAILEMVKSN